VSAPRVHRSAPRKRRIRTSKVGSVADALGPITPGCELLVLTFGQFSLIDALTYLVQQAGPSDVVLCTWTAAHADLSRTHKLLEASEITRFRLLLDHNMMRRPNAKGLVSHIHRLFGDQSVRTTRSHAKFATIRSATHTLAVRTSANLNQNPRMENIEISDDPELCAFLESVADQIWADQDAGRPLEEFPDLFADHPTAVGGVSVGRATGNLIPPPTVTP
jgi:hypothetical protein